MNDSANTSESTNQKFKEEETRGSGAELLNDGQQNSSWKRSNTEISNGTDDWSTEEGTQPHTNEEKVQSQRKRKKKVELACVYCRRSHMICDDSRPCQRCIKRGIGHLCYDEPSNLRQRKKAAALRQTPNTSRKNSPPSSMQHSPLSQSTTATNHPNPPGLNSHPSNSGILPSSDSKKVQPLPQPPVPNKDLQQQYPLQSKLINKSVLAQTLPFNQEPFFYSEHAGSEFSSLNDFLSMIDDPELVHGTLNGDGTGTDPMLGFGMNDNISQIPYDESNQGTQNQSINNQSNVNNTNSNQNNQNNQANINNVLTFSPTANLFPPSFQNEGDVAQQQLPQQDQHLLQFQQPNQNQPGQQQQNSLSPLPRPQQLPPPKQYKLNSGQAQTSAPVSLDSSHQPVISDSARDKFFLTAADPTTEISPEERLKQVIKAKLEAGLLQPYNYAKGYARLQGYMDNYMNISSRQRILKPLSIFRPAFRAIARTLKDVDLVLVEESFERMLLDYDRVFTSMAIPACLWRRTGEIYRGNKEFASLVGVMTDDLKDGKLAIYELMSEESAVNFWEKYGAIAFDKGQKAVLTSCNLRTKDGIKRKSCCFSFTIRRDRYNIPSCIVGNFIPIDP